MKPKIQLIRFLKSAVNANLQNRSSKEIYVQIQT